MDSIYAEAAQYNTVQTICRAIDAAAKKTDNLGQIFEGVVAHLGGNFSCNYIGESDTESDVGWRWQVNFMVLNSLNK